ARRPHLRAGVRAADRHGCTRADKNEPRSSARLPWRGLMLAIRDLETAYGRSQVLFGVSLEIPPSTVVSLLGRNGMGKTTTVRSIMGITPARSGTISFHGKPIQKLPSYRVAQAGLGLVPEGRQVFPNLTVRENLVATARQGPWRE